MKAIIPPILVATIAATGALVSQPTQTTTPVGAAGAPRRYFAREPLWVKRDGHWVNTRQPTLDEIRHHLLTHHANPHVVFTSRVATMEMSTALRHHDTLHQWGDVDWKALEGRE